MSNHHTTRHPAKTSTQAAVKPRRTRPKNPQSESLRTPLFQHSNPHPQPNMADLVETVARPIQHDLEQIGTRLSELINLLDHHLQTAPATGQLPAIETDPLLSQPFTVRLRHARTQANLTQQALANTIGVDRIQIVHWENGRNRPTLRYRQQIAKATGFPLHFLHHDGPGGTP